MEREESQVLYWRRQKDREPEFLVEQESGIWLEVLVFGGEEFCGDLRRRECVLEGSPRSREMALLGELPADRGTGRLHPYTGTSGLGLQAAAVMRRGDSWWERKAESSAWGCAC